MEQTKGKKRVTRNEKSIVVTVIIPPKVNISGASNLIKEGNSVKLTCEIVAGRPEPEITWLKNNTLLQKSWSLLFPKIKKKDEGLYTCKAENAAGILTEYVEISVKVPPRVKFEFNNVNIEVNSTFTKKCYRSGDPEISVNWTKDGVLLSTNNTLIIKRANFKDKGNYECTAQNDYGKANASFWIDVTVSPEITKPPITQSVTEGYPVNFSCRASGVPKPTIVWLFNNSDLPSDISRTDHDGESLLELPSVTKEMKGTYRCEAKNKANTSSSSATLRVYGKASAQIVPDPYPTLTTEDALTLTCQVNEDTIKVAWKKDGNSPSERAKIYTQLDKKESELTISKVLEEDGGKYSCEGRNKLGFVARYFVKITVKGSNSLWYYIGGSVATVIVILLIACFFCKSRRTAVALSVQGEKVQMEPSNVEVDEWEIEVSRVLLQEVIGRGAFAAVWRALLSSPNGRPGNRIVAAKCFTPTAGEEGRNCLMREIDLGKLIGGNNQPNTVKFVGCVTTQIHPILIMEYMPCGDLPGYLRKCRGVRDRYYLGDGRAQELTNYDLVMFAKQIAAGMVFLGSRGIIHRDLAARNILLDNNYVCKVTDFGMAYQSFKYCYGNAKKGCLPIKWTAPEILLGNLAGLSTLSDVWSYGIVLYEIVTIGGIPYDGWSEGRVVAEVTKGYQMPKPDHVDIKMHDMMKRCWNLNPDFRPPFENLRQRMDKYLREETYVELLNLGAYDKKKYSRVEDLGDKDAGPSDEVVKKAAAKRLGKWSSARR
ncbi:fibroblast growth factor receptor-like [Stylophora pistillata]|uniref:fibroblast growth factor receptor-like n=1 Tax=Stylophora pistillata TaxID=50429 RepID=UPI000C03B115|nr:fibroblast growth factor receptor-like [Stylophora pistillata]